MKFVVSVTMNASDLRQAIRLWNTCGDSRNPFAYVLVSPLFAQPATLRIVRELKEQQGTQVYFDSGGYYVQQGRLEYQELYERLLSFYIKNQWADGYVLPDWVPTSRDSPEEVRDKVLATVTVAKIFYDELPDLLKERVLAVVHAHTIEQIILCVETYRQFAAKSIGFGSFGTSGSTNGVNIVTRQSVEILQALVNIATQNGLHVHVFGVSIPPILYLFQQLGVSSFDSMAWMKAAGYGNIFLPLMRGYLATYQVVGRSHISCEQFEALKVLTGHHCHFCEDFSTLTSNRMYRAMHNLASMLDTIDLLEGGNFSHEQIIQIIAQGSPSYLRYYGSPMYLRYSGGS